MNKIVFKWRIAAILLVAAATLIIFYPRQLPERTASWQRTAGQQIASIPVRILIPAIELSASIEQVAVVADGSMDVPSLPMNTAWYKFGPHPGEIGSAVIAGHVNWENSAPAVFTNLHKLNPGDKITIQDDQGQIIPFVVRESRTYNATADASDIFVSQDGQSHLNLITCKGNWNQVTQSFTERLVVFADREL